MEAKSSISLVSTPRPSLNSTPILERRAKLIASLEAQLQKIAAHREGRRTSRENFWMDADKSLFMEIRYGKSRLELAKGKATIKASGGWDDLVSQIQEIQRLASSGGLDDELAAVAQSVRSNFAKPRKAGKT